MTYNRMEILLALLVLNCTKVHSSTESEMTTTTEENLYSTESSVDDECSTEKMNSSCSPNVADFELEYGCRMFYKCHMNLTEDESSERSSELEETAYCGEKWKTFWNDYDSIHIFLKLMLTGAGCLTNVVNMYVFTRRNMKSPLNTILMSLSVSDLLIMLTLFVGASLDIFHNHFGDKRTSFQKSVELLITKISYNLFHMWSVYLTLLVAGWRFFGIQQPLRSRRVLTERNSKRTIGLILLGCCLFVALMASTYDIKQKTENKIYDGITKNTSLVQGKGQDLEYILHGGPSKNPATFLSIGLGAKLIPCVLLTILTFGILWSLIKARKARKHLIQPQIENPNCQNLPSKDANKKRDRTNSMLLIILTIFLVTECPFGIYFISNRSGEFFKQCINPVGDFFALLELLSSVPSLFVYIAMSTAFRTTLLTNLGTIVRRFQWKDAKLQSSLTSTELSKISSSASV